MYGRWRNLAALAAAASVLGGAVAQAAPLTVIAMLTAAPGKEAVLKSIVVPLAATTRKEAGCLSYTLLQNNARPGQFFTYETWASKAALDAHMKGPGVALASKKLQGVLGDIPSQTLMTKIS